METTLYRDAWGTSAPGNHGIFGTVDETNIPGPVIVHLDNETFDALGKPQTVRVTIEAVEENE